MRKHKTTAVTTGDEEVDSRSSALGFSREFPVTHHDFYIYSEIGAPSEYIAMIQAIRTAEPNDQITIHLSTDGGELNTGISLISAISECRGTVTTVLDSTACSMGAILFLAGHQYIVHDCTMLMFHTFNGGFIGKSSDVDKQMQAHKRQYSMLLKRVCSKFLTADEMKRIDNGEELWFTSDTIGKRLRVLNKGGQVDTPPSRSRKQSQSTLAEHIVADIEKD